jgi:hypothetical protein
MNIPRSVDKTTGKSFKSAFENVQSFEASWRCAQVNQNASPVAWWHTTSTC